MLSLLRVQEQERFPSWDCLLVLDPLQLKKIFGIRFKMSAPWRPIGLTTKDFLNLFFNLNSFVFHWRLIALQYSAGFYHISTWSSQRYMYISSLHHFFFLSDLLFLESAQMISSIRLPKSDPWIFLLKFIFLLPLLCIELKFLKVGS